MALPAVYFSPHQDDETLSMSADILRHLNIGRPVYMVLFTDGGQTAAKYAINGKDDSGNTYSSGWWGGTHNPEVEGYAPLSWDDVYNARDTEFKSACGALGVPQSNITIIRTADRTVEGFKETFRSVISEFPPGTAYKTMSPLDTHDEHRKGAQALWELWNEGVVTDVRFWLSRLDIMNNTTTRGYPTTATADELKVIERATRAYKAWNPTAGSFAVGAHSVASQFDALLADPRFRYFTPENFTTADLPF